MMKPIAQVAHELGIRDEFVELFGRDKAKIQLGALDERSPSGKLILVSAVTPTPAGEGKTTTSIGLAQGLQRLGQKSVLALRQPSMGPVFGRKGGATGGGQSRLEPSDAINLQFTGDFHAITAAHNLLAAAIDNKIHFGSDRIDPLRVLWKRCIDSNDRGLRSIVTGLGGRSVGGTPMQTGFDITAASEVMAILCLANSRSDLRTRLNKMLIGYDRAKAPIFASAVGVTGAMMAILNEAILPNLVQTQEGTPTFVHGGPFANIAHGCNSVLATKMALSYGDWAITEAGFAFDLGGEKFLNLKCRSADLNPSAIVIVATVRALKMHGGIALSELGKADPRAVEKGLANLAAHIAGARSFHKPIIVAINQRAEDSLPELKVIHDFCDLEGVPCSTANVFGAGGGGALDLAKKVMEISSGVPNPLKFLYREDQSIHDKIDVIARTIYGAASVSYTNEALTKIRKAESDGFGQLAICMAKTQNSLSDNPKSLGRPHGFTITVRDLEIAAGAGFIVALTGDMIRMPGLPEVPAAEKIDVDEQGRIQNLL
ncbi:MAG: formate--tetrahydrofolate ligase [Proteobacteria bacterium]|nr:formate--tetrahydrofolate ligase [Pseudomonadota bacterium]